MYRPSGHVYSFVWVEIHKDLDGIFRLFMHLRYVEQQGQIHD